MASEVRVKSTLADSTVPRMTLPPPSQMIWKFMTVIPQKHGADVDTISLDGRILN
jgi:hypothetical protein